MTGENPPARDLHLVRDTKELLAREQRTWEEVCLAREQHLAAIIAYFDGELGPVTLAGAFNQEQVLERYLTLVRELHRQLWPSS